MGYQNNVENFFPAFPKSISEFVALVLRRDFLFNLQHEATTFCLNLKTSVLEKRSSLDQGCWQQILLFLLQANAQKQLTANNEQRFGTVSDISENMTQTRGTSMDGIFAKKKPNAPTFETD